MPELPEVQTIVNHLAKKIEGKVFLGAEVRVKKMVSPDLKKKIKGLRIKTVMRRAKMIVMELSDNQYLLVHLKMTGQLVYVDKQGQVSGGGHPVKSEDYNLAKPNKFTRIILKFKDNSQLLFHDVRKFGWIKLVNKEEGDEVIRGYGVEPLSKDFTLENFQDILERRSNLKIKQLLMAQELIAGIGNIYADESLFEAKISPLRQAKTLKSEEVVRLHQSIIKKLKEAIKLGGTSINTFVHPNGERGKFVERLKVYQRGGQNCFRCQSILKKIKIGGRGTVYCDKCQK